MNAKHFLPLTAVFAATLLAPLVQAADEEPAAKARRVEQARLDGLPTADLGNGYFRNPVLVGPGADNSVVRVDKDFYMTVGGNMIWHSRDLVNWRPAARVPMTGLEFTYYKGRFYVYTFRGSATGGLDPKYANLSWSERTLLGTSTRTGGNREFSTYVSYADKIEGPWSEPAEIGFYGMIDPGHIADQQGNRYLFHNMGLLVNLTPDGLQAVGDVRKVYSGWQYPKEWVVECFCLEAPKPFFRDGYYYMASAQGGTGGPSTAHMGVVARAKSLEGPWENSPYNPVIRTWSKSERWVRQGHGTFIDDVAGNWWFVYTGYENGYEFLGKQAMVLPVEWTSDGWPRVTPGVLPTDTMLKPAGENIGHGMPISDDFSSGSLGWQWRIGGGRRGGAPAGPGGAAPGRGGPAASRGGAAAPGANVKVGGGALRMQASGTSIADAAQVSVTPINHSYVVEVEVTAPDTAEAGLLLSGARTVSAGVRKGQILAYWQGVPAYAAWKDGHMFVRIRNNSGDVSVFYSADGKKWTPFDNSTSATQVRSVSLYASGQGEVVFRNFKYRGLD
jgi:xylan 1,4-beta-xylosidase